MSETKDDRFGYATVETGQSRYRMARSEYERVRQTWENYLSDREQARAVTFEDNYGGILTVALFAIESVCDFPASALRDAAEDQHAAELTDGDAGASL